MVSVITTICTLLGYDVDRVFTETNNQISGSNETAGMKITAFMGIVDLETGFMTYINAGHSQPSSFGVGQGFFSGLSFFYQKVLKSR